MARLLFLIALLFVGKIYCEMQLLNDDDEIEPIEQEDAEDVEKGDTAYLIGEFDEFDFNIKGSGGPTTKLIGMTSFYYSGSFDEENLESVQFINWEFRGSGPITISLSKDILFVNCTFNNRTLYILDGIDWSLNGIEMYGSSERPDDAITIDNSDSITIGKSIISNYKNAIKIINASKGVRLENNFLMSSMSSIDISRDNTFEICNNFLSVTNGTSAINIFDQGNNGSFIYNNILDGQSNITFFNYSNPSRVEFQVNMDYNIMNCALIDNSCKESNLLSSNQSLNAKFKSLKNVQETSNIINFLSNTNITAQLSDLTNMIIALGAVDVGTNNSAPRFDFYNNARPSNNLYDVGPLEITTPKPNNRQLCGNLSPGFVCNNGVVIPILNYYNESISLNNSLSITSTITVNGSLSVDGNIIIIQQFNNFPSLNVSGCIDLSGSLDVIVNDTQNYDILSQSKNCSDPSQKVHVVNAQNCTAVNKIYQGGVITLTFDPSSSCKQGVGGGGNGDYSILLIGLFSSLGVVLVIVIIVVFCVPSVKEKVFPFRYGNDMEDLV